MKNVFLLFAALLFCAISYGQYGNFNANYWYFGNNAGINFNSDPPSAVVDGSMIQGEGCATICNMLGELLFYTNGQQVWGYDHQLMPNGSGLNGHISATQSAIIVPVPGSNAKVVGYSQFYIFTIDAVENHLANGLCYSIVDLFENNGIGDIVEKNILLSPNMSEKILAIKKTNEFDYWLISHEWNSNRFLVYEITSSGINSIPVISEVGTIHQGGYSSGALENGWTNAIGYMKGSALGDKIALSIYRENIIELFDFDRSTGIISNPQTSSDIFTDAYGIEFSPGGKYLYATQYIHPSTGKIVQFDLQDGDGLGSYSVITTLNNRIGAIQLGPDGKLYASEHSYDYLGVINHPDEYGIACDYQRDGVFLSGKTCRTGLPTLFYHKGFKMTEVPTVDKDKEVILAPNPTKGHFIIQLDNISLDINSKLEVYSTLGELVHNSIISSSNFSVDLTGIKSGVYIIRIDCQKEIVTKKLVVE